MYYEIEKLYEGYNTIMNGIDTYLDILSMPYIAWQSWQLLLIYIGSFLPDMNIECIAPIYINSDNIDERADVVFPYQSVLNTFIYKLENIGDFKIENSYNNDENDILKWIKSYKDDALLEYFDHNIIEGDSCDDVITIISSPTLGLFFREAPSDISEDIMQILQNRLEVFTCEEPVFLHDSKIIVTDKSFYYASKEPSEYYDVYTDANPCALVLMKLIYDYTEQYFCMDI